MQNYELIPLYQRKRCANKADSEKRGLLHYGTESELLLMKPEISDIWEDMERDFFSLTGADEYEIKLNLKGEYYE